MPGKVLILGSHGRFGRHAAAALAGAGWQVTAFDRARDDLDRAAQGRDVIVMAAMPPGYHLWARELLPLHRRVVQAAHAAGATVLLPGNVYVFGPDAPFGWAADTPHLATNPLGRLRIEMEALYRDAGVPTILLRCGDFLDDAPSGGWFDRFIAPQARRGRLSYPGPLDRAHAWTWLPDAARAAAALVERRADLARWEDVPFPGYTLTGAELARVTGRALGRDIHARHMSWLPLRLARPFVPVIGGLFEMRYLWTLPHRLEGEKLRALLPDWQDTAPERAIAASLAHLGD